jgi:hypothetical protein
VDVLDSDPCADVLGGETLEDVLDSDPCADVLGGETLEDVFDVFVRTLNVVFTEFSFIF